MRIYQISSRALASLLTGQLPAVKLKSEDTGDMLLKLSDDPVPFNLPHYDWPSKKWIATHVGRLHTEEGTFRLAIINDRLVVGKPPNDLVVGFGSLQQTEEEDPSCP